MLFIVENEHIKAYYYIGEVNFDKLMIIFDFEDEKEFSWHKSKGDDNDDAEEEVNSYIRKTNARRRF